MHKKTVGRRLIDKISLELSADVAGEVRKLSDRTGESLRKLIEAAIVEYLERHKDPDYVPAVPTSKDAKEETGSAS